MNKSNPPDRSKAFEHAMEAADNVSERYVLRLFVTGTTPKSSKAIRNIRTLCDMHLRGRYELEVIDIYQQPSLAGKDQIIAAPTLIKSLPAPLRKIIGDLSNMERVLLGLNLLPVKPGHDGHPKGH